MSVNGRCRVTYSPGTWNHRWHHGNPMESRGRPTATAQASLYEFMRPRVRDGRFGIADRGSFSRCVVAYTRIVPQSYGTGRRYGL